MYIDLKLSDKATGQVENIVRLEVEKQIKGNSELLEKIIRELLKGQIKTQINNILISEGYRNYLRDKVMEYLKNE